MSPDIRRVTLDGRPFALRYCPPETPFDSAAVTSVSVTPFQSDGRLVLALLDRGPDLPGGHVDADDSSFEVTARREAAEEAGIQLGSLKLACVIESDYFGPGEPTCMLNYAGFVKVLGAVESGSESSGRAIMTMEEFLSST